MKHAYQIFSSDRDSRDAICKTLEALPDIPVGKRNATWYGRVMRLDRLECRFTHEGTRIWAGVFATIEVNKMQDIMSESEEGIEKAMFDNGKGLAVVHGVLYDEESGILLLERKGGGKLVSRFAAYLRKLLPKAEVENVPIHFQPIYSKDALENLSRLSAKSFEFTANVAHEPGLLGEFLPSTASFHSALRNKDFAPKVRLKFDMGYPESAVTRLAKRLWGKAEDKDSFEHFLIKGVTDSDGGKVDTIKLTEYPMQRYIGKDDADNIPPADGDYERLKNVILYAWNKYEGELKGRAKA